jgi:RNA polymerase sigma-70 factor (ECF subfamily)
VSEGGHLSSNNSPNELLEKERREGFAREFAQHDRWLFAYLMSLLGNPADAQEVFQEVCVTMWRDYDKYQLGTSFPKWASVVALNQVRRFRRERKRRPAILSDQAVELIASEAVGRSDLMDARREALHGCVKKLNQRDSDLIQQCYSGVYASFREAAEHLGRPENTVYKAVNRIRRALHNCIDRQVAREGN